jgi:hypothetical protein
LPGFIFEYINAGTAIEPAAALSRPSGRQNPMQLHPGAPTLSLPNAGERQPSVYEVFMKVLFEV